MKAKHFVIQELVPPRVYAARGEKAWELIDDRLIITLDQLREDHGPIIINTWHNKKLVSGYGSRTQSGLRTYEFWTDQHGIEDGMEKFNKSFSQHKYGRAFDAFFAEHNAETIREYVRNNPDKYSFLKGIETGVRWFHGDVRNCDTRTEFPA